MPYGAPAGCRLFQLLAQDGFGAARQEIDRYHGASGKNPIPKRVMQKSVIHDGHRSLAFFKSSQKYFKRQLYFGELLFCFSKQTTDRAEVKLLNEHRESAMPLLKGIIFSRLG